jgi:hypothetical protein
VLVSMVQLQAKRASLTVLALCALFTFSQFYRK